MRATCGDRYALAEGRAAAAAGMQAAIESGGGPRLLVAERLPGGRDWAGLLGGRRLATHPDPVLPLAGVGWEDLLASRSRNFRQQVRRRERKLVEEHGLRFRLSDDPARLEADLDSLVRLHSLRWGGESSGVFEGARGEFQRQFAAAAQARGWLRLWIAEIDGEAVAAWYGWRFAGSEWYYQAGRDPRFDDLSLGFVLLAHTVREAAEDGVDAYRFLDGAEAYKWRFASEDLEAESVAIGRGPVGAAGGLAASLAVRAKRRFRGGDSGRAAGLRLGLFNDAAFRVEGGRVFSGSELLGFGTFAAAVGESFDRFLLISRASEDAQATPFPLPEGVEHFPLPGYRSLRHLPSLLAAMPATVRALWRSLDEVDLVWVSAANPVGLLLAWLARLRRRPLAVLVRQDTMAYYRSRLPSRAWAPLLAPLWLVDRAFKRLGRRHPTTAVGAEIAAAYGAPRENVIEFEVNLLRSDEIPAEPRQGSWEAPVETLTVGRIEPEKTPLLLAEALASLERTDPGRFRSTWAGEGRLLESLRERAEALGVGPALSLPGFVPFGEPLLSRYRAADAYVHVALTEGVPGVICEAMACGLPIVATDVGGIRAATGDGEAAVLVPPGDAEALAGALRRLAADAELRRRLGAAGLERARRTALDVESRRVADFLQKSS